LPDCRLIGDLVFYRRVRGKETQMGSLMDELRAEYRALAVEWGEARDGPEKANLLFKAHHALYRRILESAAGREAITGLLDDPVTAVSCEPVGAGAPTG
jgi:hypothetical protein